MANVMNKTLDISTPRHEMKDIYREVSTARQALKDSYQNLQNVADYCEKNYMEAPDKRKALESTMSLVTQTLASVACQVGVAARHVSDMLEVQSLMLQKEEARVRYVSQLLDVHVEKVARRNIGKLTTAKKFQHTQKIQNGQNRPLASYTRIPINFTSLDNTGHGIMDSDSQLSRTGTMSRKISMKTMTQTHSSLGRNSRVREPIAPPFISARNVPCPISPDTISPSFLYSTTMDDDLPLPPAPSNLQTHQSPETDFTFLDPCFPQSNDFPSPPEPEANGSLWLPAPVIEDVQMPICKSTEISSKCFQPPPAFDNEENLLWPKGDGLTSSVWTQQSDDDIPPPPAPDYEITQIFWPGENADITEISTSLDDLPPPPCDL